MITELEQHMRRGAVHNLAGDDCYLWDSGFCVGVYQLGSVPDDSIVLLISPYNIQHHYQLELTDSTGKHEYRARKTRMS